MYASLSVDIKSSSAEGIREVKDKSLLHDMWYSIKNISDASCITTKCERIWCLLSLAEQNWITMFLLVYVLFVIDIAQELLY